MRSFAKTRLEKCDQNPQKHPQRIKHLRNTFHLLCLTAMTFMKSFEVFKNNVITFG